MFMYRIKEEYWDSWCDKSEDAMTPISENEIIYLARNWGTPVKELMEQVELIEENEYGIV